ncbi:MAG: capsular biosynthesis protein [Nitrospiraceae bacterium]|nr:MAG: capsular biosynthesis protein [Nitrospiraceae bacterium]
MSGTGQRFLKAGYKDIKPLIPVDGKPVIEHVIGMFPGEKDFIFICNKEHIETTNITDVLQRITPSGTIVPIAPHKLGPVHAVLQAAELICDDGPVLVNYCDFSAWWDYHDFKAAVARNQCDGCVPAYTGFHPHLLAGGFYAGMNVDAQNNMIEIREKYSFTENKMDSFHSSGSYYFRKGAFVKKYFRMLMDKDININGEYYVSMVYQLMKEDDLNIYVYNLEHFLQWGTPEDLEEYVYWSEYFREKQRAGILI